MDPDESYIDKYEDRIACSYKLTCIDDRFSEPVHIKPEMHFISLPVKCLKNLSIVNELQKTKSILLKETHHIERNFEMVSKGHICNKLYTEKDIRVRDHSHITGKYRGSAHQICYANYRLMKKIPVIFHNRGYQPSYNTRTWYVWRKIKKAFMLG